MPNHFTAIGFDADRDEDIQRLVIRAAREGQHAPAGRGYYRIWSPGEGTGLWVGVDGKSNEILGCEPSFSGHGQMRLGLESFATESPTYAPLEGGLEGWADPGDEPGSGLCPVVVDIPGFDLVRPRLRLRQIVPLQVSAFAHRLECYATDEDFGGALGNKTPKFSPEFFIPSGLFGEGGGARRAYAAFAGHVKQAVVRTNPSSGRKFHHVLAQSAAGLFDVVADPGSVQGNPVVGGVVSGEFWLSGRVLGLK